MLSAFRVPLLLAIGLAVAFGGGIWSAVAALQATAGFGAITIGAWTAFPEAQTARADPYARAHRARHGDLLLGTAEGLVFAADTDSAGRALSGMCSYRIAGDSLAARYWTLHVTDGEERTIAAPRPLPGALFSSAVLRDPKGRFTITAGRHVAPGNWLALDHEGPVRLVLTLFDTPMAGSAGLVDVVLPAIEPIRCRNA